jgi:hypothetical protein
MPFIIFNLLTIHLVDDFWIDICDLELECKTGALFSIRYLYGGQWEFDFLYFHLFYTLYLNWREKHEAK